MKSLQSILKATVFVLSLVITSNTHAQSLSCEGVTMQSEGDKISTYLSAADGMTRNIYATIRQDSVIMTVFRTKPDGNADMLKKWHVYIGDLDFSQPTTGVFHWMNGGEKIHKLNFIVVSGRNFYYQEMLCSSVKKLNIVTSSNPLEMSFNDEAKAKAFFEKMKSIKVTLPETKTAGATKSNEKLDPFLSIYNDTKKEVCLKGEHSQIQCYNSSSEHTIMVSVGDDVNYVTKDGKKMGLAFKVTEQMMKDHRINLSNQAKK
jgi:hypothetical protein